MSCPDFTLRDEGDQRWSLREHLDGNAVAIVFYRGDW